jgi:hypothetical protein
MTKSNKKCFKDGMSFHFKVPKIERGLEQIDVRTDPQNQIKLVVKAKKQNKRSTQKNCLLEKTFL